MAGSVTQNRRRSRRSKSGRKSRTKISLQKPKGVISPRVKKVGGDKFAFVCIDPAKLRSEWMMADYYGNLLLQPQTLKHQAEGFQSAIDQIRQAQVQHSIQDMIVVVERTGNYYLPPKRALAKAGFEVRVLHPFATKQFRQPADPGNKTDETDLYAQHRAAVQGFGLAEPELDATYRELQLRIRHRRNLVENSSALACQVRDHLHLCMPGYAALFDHLLDNKVAMAMARCCESPAKVLELGPLGIGQYLRENNVRFRAPSLDKIVAWASQAAETGISNGLMHHAIWTDLEDLYQCFQRRIRTLESQIASNLVKTPYIRLLALPGINVVSAGDLAGEMGPISSYANANAITGRSGLFPSRYQSDQTDCNGSILRQANRRLRAALMRIADNLADHCEYYRGRVLADQALGMDKRAARIKVVNKFSRVTIACVGGDEPMRHPAFRKPDSILEKLRIFHLQRNTPLDRILEDLNTAVRQLPKHTCDHEAVAVAEVLKQQTSRKKDSVRIGELLTAVLARLEISTDDINENRDRP